MPKYANYPQAEKFPLAVRLLEHGTVPLDNFLKHEFSEIAIVSRGHALHKIGTRKQEIAENDVLVIHPGTENLFSDGVDFELFLIIYDSRVPLPALKGENLLFLRYLYPPEDFRYDQLQPVAKIPEYDHELYLNLIRRLSYETHRDRIGRSIMIPTMFTELAVYLARGKSAEHEKERLWLLQSPVEYLNAHFREPLDLPKLCRLAGMSERSLFRHFQRVLGMTPNRYMQKIRVQRAMDFLEQNNLSLQEIAMRCGFYDGNHFAKVFHAVSGEPPSAFRRKILKSGGSPDQ